MSAARPASLSARLSGLFFLHALAPGLWMLSLGNVLGARGWQDIVPLAFALGPVAALVSPLWVGALADQRVDARRLLRWLLCSSALFLAAGFYGLQSGCAKWWFLVMHGCHNLCFSSTWSLVATIGFAHSPDPVRQYPRLRVWSTMSWVAAGALTSFGLRADSSPLGGLIAVAVLLVAAVYTWCIPPTPPGATAARGRGWRAVFGLEALSVFRTGDYRVFLLTTALLAVPLSGFFPFAPQMLVAMGVGHPTAWMSLGQVVESVSMLLLPWLVLRWRIKVVMAAGLAFATARYLLLATGALCGATGWIYPGLAMHGLIFTLYFVTSQVFLELRVDASLRARAQALLTTVSGGIGMLVGTLGCGWWQRYCLTLPLPALHAWALFWLGLAGICAAALAYFLSRYRGRGAM